MKYRQYLTDCEWNAIAKYTSRTHLDQSFDVYHIDYFKDYEANRLVSLKTGLRWIYEALAEPLTNCLDTDEAFLIAGLLEEFHIVDDASSLI